MSLTALTPRLSVVESLAGKHLFVTGVTGFLGKVWLAQVLQHHPDVRLTVLVRGRHGQSPGERVEEIVNTSPALRPLRATGRGWVDRIHVVAGDVRKPRCGLHPRDMKRIRESVDAVVHFAGLTDFEPDPVDAIASNIHGARHAADVAARLAVARLVHVSTSFVVGRSDGTHDEDLAPRVAPSCDVFDPSAELLALEAAVAAAGSGIADKQARIDAALARARALGWPNIYTYTKALAERTLAGRDDIDLTIARPTIVECALEYPFAGWNEGVNTAAPLSWLISTAFRNLPSRDGNHFDIAPVDLVGRGISLIVAAALHGQAGGVFHLGTSDTNPTTFGRIIELNGLATRRLVRRDPEATAWERLVTRHLDPVAVAADRQGLLTPGRLRGLVRGVRKTLKNVDVDRLPEPIREVAGESIATFVSDAVKRLGRMSRDLGRIDEMLALYQPFTHDHDHVFRTDRIRALSAGLPAEERALFAWNPEAIDWRHYWVEVEVPGLNTWSIPLLRGEQAPVDDAPDPAIRLDLPAPARLERTA